MTPTKTAGGQEPSDKFVKKDAAAKGLGADNTPTHKDGHAPGQAPVASDSGLPVSEASVEEASSGTGNLTSTGDVGRAGLKAAQPGSAAPGPDVAGA